MNIDIGQTHIRLKSDIADHNLRDYIYQIRADLKTYINHNQDFLISMEPVGKINSPSQVIVQKMYESSKISDVGPMACVAGTISQLSLEYLISKGTKYSIIENGGDIALINDKKVLCGIYSGNELLGNDISFEIKKRKTPIGICTSSGKIGHSISLGTSDSVTVVSKSPSLADGLATRIANEVTGDNSEDKVLNAVEKAEEYKDFYNGVLIVSDNHVATAGKLPKIVQTHSFEKNI